ncbi:MAG: hypothetical protein ABSF26_12085 [Thermoguttaceae bacterium]|jgi:hypothetical protein
MRRKGFVDWADATSMMIVFLAALVALVGAREAKAGVAVTILFTLGGLLVGLSLGTVSGRLAYLALNSRKSSAAVFLAYLFTPLLFMFGTVVLIVWLAKHLL